MRPGNGSFSLGVVILAAGASSRMGKAKLLLPWGTTSVLGHLLQTWRQVGGAQVVPVCASGDELMKQELARLGVSETQRIINTQPEHGMFSSIQRAAEW